MGKEYTYSNNKNKKLTTEQIIQTKEFIDFYKLAIDFCDFIENYPNNIKIEFLKTTRQYLLKLYDSALRLQYVDLQSNVEYDNILDNKEFENILLHIADRFNDSRYYWHVFDPTDESDTDAVCGDLVDDLGDIYDDLKSSIIIFNLNKTDCKEIAIWQFKFDFDKHWDDHCINALNAIHYILQNE